MSKINISKREELVLVSLFLSALVLVVFFVPLGPLKFIFLIVTCLLTYLLAIFVLRGDLERIEYLMLPIPLVLFSVSAALFYNIIPERWLTRMIFISVYGVLTYSFLLIGNVFNVAKTKNIQLLKVARTIYFFISSFTVFLFSYVMLSFHLPGILTSFIFSLFVFLISLTFFWSFRLTKELKREDLFLSLATAVILFELTLALSFWPLNIYLISLFLTSIYYSLLGIWNNLLSCRLKGWNMLEYLVINLIVFAFCILTVSFG